MFGSRTSPTLHYTTPHTSLGYLFAKEEKKIKILLIRFYILQWNGTAVTGSAISYTATGTETGPLWTALMTTFGVDDDDSSSSGFRGGDEEEDLYTGVVTTPMVTLVHKAGDMTEGAGEGEGEGDGGGSGGAALRVAGAGGDVGMLIAVWVVAALVGAVVVFPS